jgi:hypothetical protein
MHFTHHIEVNGDIEFHYYKKFFKILIVKTTGLCNWTSFGIEWVKQHRFNNLLVTNCICLSWLQYVVVKANYKTQNVLLCCKHDYSWNNVNSRPFKNTFSSTSSSPIVHYNILTRIIILQPNKNLKTRVYTTSILPMGASNIQTTSWKQEQAFENKVKLIKVLMFFSKNPFKWFALSKLPHFIVRASPISCH